jgi:hypothetical protein
LVRAVPPELASGGPAPFFRPGEALPSVRSDRDPEERPAGTVAERGHAPHGSTQARTSTGRTAGRVACSVGGWCARCGFASGSDVVVHGHWTGNRTEEVGAVCGPCELFKQYRRRGLRLGEAGDQSEPANAGAGRGRRRKRRSTDLRVIVRACEPLAECRRHPLSSWRGIGRKGGIGDVRLPILGAAVLLPQTYDKSMIYDIHLLGK